MPRLAGLTEWRNSLLSHYPKDNAEGKTKMQRLQCVTWPMTSRCLGADLMKPDRRLMLLTERLTTARRGIIPQTANMCPALPRNLRDNRCLLVHLVPAAAPAGTVAANREMK